MFSRIHRSYTIRSEGGQDDLGNSFPPLKKTTIARRPIGKGNLGEFGLTSRQSGTALRNRERGLLSPEENVLWKSVYSSTLSQLIIRMPEKQAKQRAAATAWIELKASGAKTKLDTLGNRNVLIMRVTDTIYNSLAPNHSGSRTYRPRRNQIFKQVGSRLEIGTSVPHAKYHNSTRPVIPDNIQPWVDEATETAFDAVNEHIIRRVL